MLDELINNLTKKLIQIESSLNENHFYQARQGLKIAAIDFNKIMEIVAINFKEDASFFQENSKQKIDEPVRVFQKIDSLAKRFQKIDDLADTFKALSMRCCFAFSYSYLSDYDTAVERKDFLKAEELYQKIRRELNFMREEYVHAIEENKQQTAAFVDFPKDYAYLYRNAQESVKKYVDATLGQVCRNLTNAFNFQETQKIFGMDKPRYTLFSASAPVSQSNIDHDISFQYS